MSSEPSLHPTIPFKRGDAVEVDCHSFTETGEAVLSVGAGTVTRVCNGAIYTDLQTAPFDQETFLPLGSDGRLVAPGGVISLLRHADDPCLPLPPIEVIALMGLPNLKDWETAILKWNMEEPESER
jgi:hypothetical protein